MNQKKLKTSSLPLALVSGLLEDSGRYFFIIRKLQNGKEKTETLDLLSVKLEKGNEPTLFLKEEFRDLFNMEVSVDQIIYEAKTNAGSKKHKSFVPLLVFKVEARNRTARISESAIAKGVVGYKWLSLLDAKKQKLSKNCTWILNWKKSESPL